MSNMAIDQVLAQIRSISAQAQGGIKPVAPALETMSATKRLSCRVSAAAVTSFAAAVMLSKDGSPPLARSIAPIV